jgi:hypothetical protein
MIKIDEKIPVGPQCVKTGLHASFIPVLVHTTGSHHPRSDCILQVTFTWNQCGSSTTAWPLQSLLYKLLQHHTRRLGCAQRKKVERLNYGRTSTVFWFETFLTKTSSYMLAVVPSIFNQVNQVPTNTQGCCKQFLLCS